MPRLTLIHAYFDAAAVLKAHVEEWLRYPRRVRDGIEIVMVDDGSPDPLADAIEEFDLPGCLDVRVYRALGEKIPWNQHGCRNLGATEAKADWLLLLDMDKLLRAGDMARLWDREWRDDRWYRFAHQANGQPYHNQFMCRREHFLQIGGYKAELRGYGGDSAVVGAKPDQPSDGRGLDKVAERAIWPDVRLRHMSEGRTTAFDRKQWREVYLTEWRAFKDAGYPAQEMVPFEWERVR